MKTSNKQARGAAKVPHGDENTHLLRIRKLSEVMMPDKNTFYRRIWNITNHISAEVLAILKNTLL